MGRPEAFYRLYERRLTRGLDPEHAFRRLAALGARLRQTHPEATALSMGMSADLEAAVRAGATQVRIGSDVLGARDAVG